MQSSRKPRILILIAAFYAECPIERVLRRIPASLSNLYDVEILIIDDGSSDQTFREGVKTGGDGSIPFEMLVLYNPVNQRYAGNRKIGYHYAISLGFDFVALLHGDGLYVPEILPDLVRPFKDGPEQIFVPRGLAHAFCTLQAGTEVLDKVDASYDPECDNGIIWNDPTLAIALRWRSKAAPFRAFCSPFR